MHSLHNYVEGVRRRIKNLEDLEGTSECVATIKQLKVDHTAGGSGKTKPLTTMMTLTTTPGPKPVLETILEEATETEEDILER
jgi:hypothetical protein